MRLTYVPKFPPAPPAVVKKLIEVEERNVQLVPADFKWIFELSK